MRISPFSVAQESLGQSTAMRGLDGMQRTAAPLGPNMMDSGPASKVGENTQGFNNARMQQQNILQNTVAAAPQAGADAKQQMNKQLLVESNAEQAFLRDRLKEVTSVMDTPAVDTMGGMSDTEGAAFRQNIATGKAMGMGVNPDIVLNNMPGQQYI